MSIAGYYRYPTIAQHHVVFVSEDDLWTVDQDGGVARRLTAGWGSATRPLLSPDGQWIAFVGREEGDNEVYIMPQEGGEVTRLTYLGANTQPVAFHPDGSLIISSNAGQPFRSLFMLYRLPLSGGEPEPMHLGPANNIAFGPNQGVVLGRNTADPARWKRYRGGTRGQLWIDQDGSGHFERYEGVNGNFASPMWIGNRIYFISDHEGYANIYSIEPDGRHLERHTDHETYYVRNASTDGHFIVYHAGADLYVLDPLSGEDTRLAIEYYSQKTQVEPYYAKAQDYWTDYALSPSGDKVLITTRGKLFQMGNWEGPVEPLGALEGVRYRLSQWIPGSDQILTISDDGGEEGLKLLDPKTHSRTRFPGSIGQATDLKVSPDGQFAVLANQRHELWLADLKAFTLSQIDGSIYGPVRGINFSPDSRWVAYGLHQSSKTCAIKVYNLISRESQWITRPVLIDSDPVFDPAGRFLYFLSYRVFDPVYDNLRFDLGFPNGMHPYLIPLQKDQRSPFMPEPRPVVDTNDKSETEGSDANKLVTIDFEGILDRAVPFPVQEGLYRQLEAGPDKVYWTTVEPHGSLHTSFYDSESAQATLHEYSLKDLKEDVLGSHITSFSLNALRNTMAIRLGKKLRIAKAGDKLDEKASTKPGRETGFVDFQRISLFVNRRAEWEQMLREAWRLMRDNFWSESMSGIDWEQIFHRYQILLPRVATRSEFSDLVWEMQGELGTSHAYEIGGDYRKEPSNRIGFLAAKWRWVPEFNGYQITEIARGDSTTEGENSPLLAPGIDIQEGDIVTMVDNKPLDPSLPPEAHLINKAKQSVRLSYLRPGDSALKTADVIALPQEMPVYYRQWVNRNREKVHKASSGRLGYVHIPDMGPRGFAEFYRAYLKESEYEGLIVDVRFNGGGHVSQLILENLQRQRLGYDVPRHGQPEPYPQDSILGPIVALTNEYAGSDGDIFSHSFKLMGIGPLVGQRTWGGVIGIWARHRLVDGSITTQPEFSFWFKDVGWGVENYGTDPTIPVENRPEDYQNGNDRQLDRAIEEGMRLLTENPPKVPDFSQKPVLTPGHLPPRPQSRA